ncbi:DUF2931 family protein [Dyella kyungheensis]|uniref:DUF2931 family protein n=1 Tax=Dyella kyungheensis TaxID=1242174 RepID=A0ABS2JWQ7_9GAMM|nr:DUF2931 family protein [Dyella kyungheensis]MBM7123331.1 DUF2931 family protein [Dyella kyungheensis]
MIPRLPALLLVFLGLSACGDSRTDRISGPCPHWAITTVSPRHMEAWIETLYVKDSHGSWLHIPQGVVGELPDTVGWSGLHYGGGGPQFLDAGAPMEIYVRWQSLVEPQTYNWRFTVPESMRQMLLKRELGKVWYKPRPEMACRSDITVGVAPGGHAILWVDGQGLASVEITRGQATVEPLGPGQGWGKGYAYPPSEDAKKYVEEHGIPYESW